MISTMVDPISNAAFSFLLLFLPGFLEFDGCFPGRELRAGSALLIPSGRTVSLAGPELPEVFFGRAFSPYGLAFLECPSCPCGLRPDEGRADPELFFSLSAPSRTVLSLASLSISSYPTHYSVCILNLCCQH